MGSQGQIISGNKNNSGTSSLMGLMDMYKKMSASGTGDGTSDNTPGNENVGDQSGYGGAAAAGVDTGQISGNAVDRRVENNNNHPDALIAQGVKHADNLDVPMDYDTRMAVVEPLLRAQHLGYGGGYEKGSQGQITSGKAPDSGGLGKIASIATIVA